MEGKDKRNRLLSLILRTWRRPRLAVPRTTSCTRMPLVNPRRCRSLSDSDGDDMAREGYFAVYVGPDRDRFVINTESINHPVFRKLLEEAEKEYGFDFTGPLTLPCEVSDFRSILDNLKTDYGDECSMNGQDVRRGLLGVC